MTIVAHFEGLAEDASGDTDWHLRTIDAARRSTASEHISMPGDMGKHGATAARAMPLHASFHAILLEVGVYILLKINLRLLGNSGR